MESVLEWQISVIGKLPLEQLSPRQFLGENCPDGNFSWWEVFGGDLVGVILWVSCPGGSWDSPRWEFSGLEGLGWNYSGESCL